MDLDTCLTASQKAIVIGDLMLDRNLTGQVKRLSPEGPVPVVSLGNETRACGGAGNVAASLAALGFDVTTVGTIGCDSDGEALLQTMRACGLDISGVFQTEAVTTIAKTRIWAEGFHQLIRLDRDGEQTAYEQAAEAMWERTAEIIPNADVIVIADYDKGTITDSVAEQIITAAREYGIPCIVDSKRRNMTPFWRSTLMAPNQMEVERALGYELPTLDDVSRAAEKLRTDLDLDYMIITVGARGMIVATEGRVLHVAAEAREVADVTGAGDTVVAAVAAALAEGHDIEYSTRLASRAAAIAVSHRGTYVVTRRELETSSACNDFPAVAADWDAARRRVAEAQEAGQRVVFTNGCFDILHAGHLSCLKEARRHGDMLVVGLNSDMSVKMNKGESRPINNQTDRATLLAGLSCVDLIVLFDELTPENLVRHIMPDVLVKGGDYDPLTMAGSEFVRSRGGQAITIPLVPGLSTTGILAAGVKNV